MNTDRRADQKEILDYIETVSGEIQLLALNIAVAAARLAHSNKIGVEVNQNLANLVNQATRAVKQMNHLIDAARTEKSSRKNFTDDNGKPLNGNLPEDMDSVMSDIIRDSEKIVRLLANVKKR
ncbi:MAG: hypothetical protein JSW64_08500 [Candidatus Zixiibacteriota bacterium]|nr:MAG: hypothetical protein JSW64_08500 [candidate division Zixibacteria bacterium]